ncbi:MAG TPA: hypothetical protein VHC22_14025 [Pirellulales bacterium]|nr:hypothetical protein [Pirellulales bacterium]
MDSARNRQVLHFLAAVMTAFVCSQAIADDFHVDNKVYRNLDDKHEKPELTTTLFASGRVYDFTKAPDETIVFDPGQDRVILLDPNRQMKTHISTGDISTQISKLREAAKSHSKEVVRDAAAAKFSESVDPDTGVLRLTNRWMKYEIETSAPARPQVARQYADFADWQKQLNSILNPPDMPFPRLTVNRILRQRQELPVKITLTVTAEDKWHKERVMRSEHTILMTLAKEDLKRIEQAAEQMHKFDEVTFDEYHNIKNEARVQAEASLKR